MQGAASACFLAVGLFLCGLGGALAIAEPSPSSDLPPGTHSNDVQGNGPKGDSDGKDDSQAGAAEDPQSAEDKPGNGENPGNGNCGNDGMRTSPRGTAGPRSYASPRMRSSQSCTRPSSAPIAKWGSVV